MRRWSARAAIMPPAIVITTHTLTANVYTDNLLPPSSP
jgi:hypothetical protein